MFNLHNHKKAQLEGLPELDPAVEDFMAEDPVVEVDEEVQEPTEPKDIESQISDILTKKMDSPQILEAALDEAYELGMNSPQLGSAGDVQEIIEDALFALFPENQNNLGDAVTEYMTSKKQEDLGEEADDIGKDYAIDFIYSSYVHRGLGEATGPEKEVVEDVAIEEVPDEPEGASETIEESIALASEEGKMKKSFNLKEQKTASVEKKADTDKMQKTAGGWGGGGTTHSILYGPEEKRYCPKLRNVISLYNCRYYCLDGMVVDDNKVLCGEAVWRQNLMDKYSRAYRNEDGEWVGGYIDKRFEVHHDTEDPQYQLKPGERRRPIRTDEFSTERRLSKQREGDLPESIAPREKTAYNHKKKKVANMSPDEELVPITRPLRSGFCPSCDSPLSKDHQSECQSCRARLDPQLNRWVRPIKAEPGAVEAPQGIQNTNIDMDSQQGQQLGKQMSNKAMTKETDEDWDEEDEVKPKRKLSPQEEGDVRKRTFEQVAGTE